MKVRSLFASLALLAFTSTVQGQALSAPDKAFVEKAAKGNLAEVELGKLASQKGSDQQVKAFGDQMVADHSKANDNLKPIADAGAAAWPARLTGEPKATYDRLSKLSGAEFDKAYIHAMVEDHQKDANAYQMESSKAKDSRLKTYVTQTLPIVQHLSHAQQIQRNNSRLVGVDKRAYPRDFAAFIGYSRVLWKAMENKDRAAPFLPVDRLLSFLETRINDQRAQQKIDTAARSQSQKELG